MERHNGTVRVLQEELPDQVFKVAGADEGLQLLKVLPVIERQEGVVIGVEPVVQDVQAEGNALREAPEVRLPVVELIEVDAGKEGLFVDAVPDEILKGLLNRSDKLVLVLLIRELCGDAVVGLADAGLVEARHRGADVLLADGLLDRGAFCIAEGIVQNLEGEVLLLIFNGDGDVPGEHGLLRRVLVLKDRNGEAGAHRRCKGLLQGNFRVRVPRLVLPQVVLVEPGKALLHVHISVEEDVAVGGMVERPVEVQVLLIGKVRDVRRVSAGDVGIGRVRVEACEDLVI